MAGCFFPCSQFSLLAAFNLLCGLEDQKTEPLRAWKGRCLGCESSPLLHEAQVTCVVNLLFLRGKGTVLKYLLCAGYFTRLFYLNLKATLEEKYLNPVLQITA